MIAFVGAGPGAADLITLRGRDRLARADVVIWASSLIPPEILAPCRPEAQIHDSASMTLEDVLAVYSAADPDAAVVRLHSGDPCLYGAIGEQIEWCQTNGRAFEIIPGVSSLGAAAAVIARELTLPGVAQSVVLTRIAGRTAASMPPGQSVADLARAGATMAIFLSASLPAALVDELLAPGSAYTGSTPAWVVARASWADEVAAPTTVGGLAATLQEVGARTTVLVLVGPALAGTGRRSHLYSPDFAHGRRRRSAPATTTGRPA